MTDEIKTQQELKKRGRKPKEASTITPEAPVIASEPINEELNSDVVGSEENAVEDNTEASELAQAEQCQDDDSEQCENGEIIQSSEDAVISKSIDEIALDTTLGLIQEPEVIEEVTEEHIPVLLKHVRLNPLIEEVLYIASLGGKLTPKKYPQLKRVPFTICMDIPKEKYQIYLDTEDRLEYSELEDYNEVVVRNPDPIKFLQLLIDTSKRGSVLAPKKIVSNTDMFKACVLTTAPIESKPNVSVSAKKRIYSLEELHKMKMNDLKVIAKWWGVEKAGNTVTMVKRIREAQDEWVSRGVGNV